MSRTLDFDLHDDPEASATPSQTRYRLAFVAMAFLLFFFLVMVSVGSTRTDLTIALRNQGDRPLRNVVVRMPDSAQVMGFLAAGGERSVRTRATRNAPVRIEFIDGRGRFRNLETSVRLQPGEVGTVTIDLDHSRVRRVFKETRQQTRT